MKRMVALFCVIFLLAGCGTGDGGMDRALNLRVKLQNTAFAFQAVITADYGDKTYSFAMDCKADKEGNVNFEVVQPESIAGITGKVSQGSGKLTFDDQVLAFDILADDLISPVSGPWVLVKTLRSGYLTSCGEEGGALRLAVDDSYENDALHLDIWLDEQDLPQRCEVLWQGRRLLSMEVKNFQYL